MDELDRWASAGMPSATETDREARNFALFAHLGGFAAYFFPFGGVLAALAIWLLKRDQHPYVDDQGREALNFQISISIYTLVSLALILVVVGIFILPVVALFHIVMMVIAAIKASNGEPFRYPLTLRLVR